MGKKDSKHKKKSYHTKKKKERKHKEKSRKHRKKCSSTSDSDASSDSGSCGADTLNRRGGTIGFPPKISGTMEDDIIWNDLFLKKYTISGEKNEPMKKEYSFEKPGQSTRELNPYWKDGGNGLPPTTEEVPLKFKKAYDVKSLKKLLQNASNLSDVTGIPLAQIIKEEWGPLEMLKQIIEDSENETLQNQNQIIQHTLKQPIRESKNVTEITGRKFKFLKPGEGSSSEFMNSSKQNWRKKEEKQDETIEPAVDQNKSLYGANNTVSEEEKSLLTPDKMNALVAKKIKAEIMGNKILAEKLEREIELAKKGNQPHCDAGGKIKEKEEIVVVGKSVAEKMRKLCETDCAIPQCSRKRQRGETHKGNERLRYFMDDDKHSLKSMFEREKHGTAEQSDELFFKLAKSEKFRSNNDDNDFDNDFLDRVRCNDYERYENYREMSKAVNEAKSKHKSLKHCRWCLDGNSVEKHLIISIGSKCYLCLPNDKSLTNGHCLIVPIHHETCGTLLDEDVWNEIHSYRNRLCKMFEDAGQNVLFFENARSFKRFPHMVLHCVPMDKEIGELAPIYFKKAITECETEWSNNKKLVDLRKRELRRSVPKGLPYFAVHFGSEGGFAHVIEDEKLFPPNFAEEIIGGMLDLDVIKWRTGRRESFEAQKEKAKKFLDRWREYGDSESRPARLLDSSDSDNVFASVFNRMKE